MTLFQTWIPHRLFSDPYNPTRREWHNYSIFKDWLVCTTTEQALRDKPGFLHERKIVWTSNLETTFQTAHRATCRNDTSRRQRRRVPPCPLLIVLVLLKCSKVGILQFPHRVPHLPRRKMPWCPNLPLAQFKNEKNVTAPIYQRAPTTATQWLVRWRQK